MIKNAFFALALVASVIGLGAGVASVTGSGSAEAAIYQVSSCSTKVNGVQVSTSCGSFGGGGSSSLQVCHDGVTKNVSTWQLISHVLHGDSVGACPAP